MHSRVNRPGSKGMPEELLPVVKPNVVQLQIFGCKVKARVQYKAHKALDAKAKYGVLPKCLSYGKFGIMLNEKHSVKYAKAKKGHGRTNGSRR